jgi:MFS family permease
VKSHNELKGKAFLFLLFLWCLWFIYFTLRTIFGPILPLIEDEFVISHAKASSIFIFQSAGFAISVLLSGFYSGKFGYKKTILGSLLIASSALLLIQFVKIFLLFYIFAFVSGFAMGLYLPSAISLITEHFVERDWGKSISIHDSAASIAIFSTPFVTLFLLHFLKWKEILVVFAVLSLIGAVIFYFISDEVKIVHTEEKTFYGDLIKNKALWTIGIVTILSAGANTGIYLITPLYLTKELLLSIDHANTILGISRFGGIGVAILCGFLADKINLKKIMFIMMLGAGILTILIGIAPVRFTGIVFFLQALFVTGLFPLIFVLIARIFSRERRSMATSIILTIGSGLGNGIIPYLLGLSGDLLSFRVGISILGILVTMASWLILSLRNLESGYS